MAATKRMTTLICRAVILTAAAVIAIAPPSSLYGQVVIDMPAPKKPLGGVSITNDAGDLALHRYAEARSVPYATSGFQYRYPIYGSYGFYGYPFGFGFPIFACPVKPVFGKFHGINLCSPGFGLKSCAK